MRRFDEPIQVRVDTAGDTEAAGSAGVAAPAELTGSLVGRPTAFLWRGRLHVVRSVEGHWQERRSWWRGEGAGVAMGDRRVWRVHAQA
ncbi:MAG TPA: DUF6504 family protein, partial [Phycicoccus sp.]|nr:DUF6504 family protein [Phycicoccus sp.]